MVSDSPLCPAHLAQSRQQAAFLANQLFKAMACDEMQPGKIAKS
jgi:hypothetical protein